MNGLHMRTSTRINQSATEYVGSILIKNVRSGKTANAKKLLNILALAIKQHEFVEVKIEGQGAKHKLELIEQLF